MAKAKSKRPIGHARWDQCGPGAPVCTTCDETWPCKIWRGWTQTDEYQQAERVAARIRASVESGRGKSMFPDDPAAVMPLFGAQCRCGVPRKPPGIMKHVNDDGLCIAHPDRPPQPWTRGAGQP